MFSLVIVALLGESLTLARKPERRASRSANADGIRSASQDQLSDRNATRWWHQRCGDPRLRGTRRFARRSQASGCLHLVSVVVNSKHKGAGRTLIRGGGGC